MEPNEIGLELLRTAVNDILDHLVHDLGIDSVPIAASEDFYWTYSAPEAYDSSRRPEAVEVGRLLDDLDFVRPIHRGESADISYNLVHVPPLLQYIGQEIRR